MASFLIYYMNLLRYLGSNSMISQQCRLIIIPYITITQVSRRLPIVTQPAFTLW